MIATLFELFCRVAFKSYCYLTSSGHEHLPPRPYLICSNHCSHMDTPALMTALGGRYRQYAMLAAKDYFIAGIGKVWNWIFQLIPVERRATVSSVRELLKNCQPYLDKKVNLIMYPEGTRSITGEMRPLKSGVSMIAKAFQLQVVPVYIDGTYRLMKKGTFFPRPGRLHLYIGKPISVSEKMSLSEVTECIQQAIVQLKTNADAKKSKS